MRIVLSQFKRPVMIDGRSVYTFLQGGVTKLLSLAVRG